MEQTLLLSSSTANGALNKSADGSQFQVQLEQPLKIPQDAKYCKAQISDAQIWWTIPNIITGENDSMDVTGPRASDDAKTNYTFTIPQGLYDLSAITSSILNELENQGAKIDPLPIIDFEADEATQRVVLILNYADSAVDFTIANSPREILGFDSADYTVPGAIVPYNQLAPNNAAFNQVNSFEIHGDVVDAGISKNGTFTDIVAKVPITVSPGSQILYAPFYPIPSQCQNLIGATRQFLRFWLTDELGRAVNTNGEDWQFSLTIKWG